MSVGGPVWRTNLADLGAAVGLWRFGIEPGLIGTLRCEDRQVTDRVRRSPAVGALWLALSAWRSNLAVSVGGPVWQTCFADLIGGVGLWRCGIEPRLIGTLRCDDRQATDRVRCSPAVGTLWVALSAWRSNLAVSVGGPVRADLVGGVACGGAGLSRD